MALSFLVVRGSTFGVAKIGFCASLITGMLLCVQPPLLFNTATATAAATEAEDDSVPTRYTGTYFVGAAMAVACAMCGALCNIFISK